MLQHKNSQYDKNHTPAVCEIWKNVTNLCNNHVKYCVSIPIRKFNIAKKKYKIPNIL